MLLGARDLAASLFKCEILWKKALLQRLTEELCDIADF